MTDTFALTCGGSNRWQVRRREPISMMLYLYLTFNRLDPKAFTFIGRSCCRRVWDFRCGSHTDDMIVTKCDDISPKEITKALRLGDNPQYQKLQNDVQHHKTEVAKC